MIYDCGMCAVIVDPTYCKRHLLQEVKKIAFGSNDN